VSDLAKLRQVEDENRRLKKIVADQALNIEALKMSPGGKILRPVQRRAGVQAAKERLGAKERSICRWMGINRKPLHYVSKE
jgi:hypothetical protein